MKRNKLKCEEVLELKLEWKSDQDSEAHYVVTAGYCLIDYGVSKHNPQVVAQNNQNGDFAMVKLKDQPPQQFIFRNPASLEHLIFALHIY